MAEASASLWVVTATESATSVSHWIADAGTGEPGAGPIEASLINLAQPLSDTSRQYGYTFTSEGSARVSDRRRAAARPILESESVSVGHSWKSGIVTDLQHAGQRKHDD